MSALSWVYYVVGVSLLVGIGTLGLEAMLRASGRGGRWAWLLALMVMAVVPVAPWLRSAAPAAPPALDVLAVPLALLPPITVTPEARVFDIVALLPWLWAAASLLFVVILVLSWLALRRATRHWREAELEGVPLWISARTGPAVVGVRRPRIVLPEWVLELAAADRRLTVLHEHEHLLAGDARLLLAGLGTAVLLPWNPVVWWALHRLHGALELDCDERVLRRAGDPAAYGRLLLEVGRRRTERYLLAAAFAEPRVLLERRVRALLRWPGARRPLVAVAAGAAALLCFGFAYVTPNPLARGARQPAAPDATSLLMPSDTPPPLAAQPTFTPFTAAPELQNRDEIVKALIAEYPPLLKSAGIGGKVIVWVFIDESGVVANALVKATSGRAELDSAGVHVAKQMRFAPALNGEQKVPVWVEIPVVFKTDGAKDSVPQLPAPGGRQPDVPPPGLNEPRIPPPVVPRDQLGRAPSFTPFTLAPELTNRDEITKLLVASYPPTLKAAGIGGKILVWVFIDEQGTVASTQVKVGSGRAELDSAALTVARAFRFRPAQYRDKPVPVWVEIPIVFELDGHKPDAREQAIAAAAREFDGMAVKQRGDSVEFTGTQRGGGGGVAFTASGRRIANPEEVLVALSKAYPAQLRKAGVGGTVQLRLFLNEQGVVTNSAVSESSGRPQLDSAALKVGPVYRFTPGPAGWLLLPVKFEMK